MLAKEAGITVVGVALAAQVAAVLHHLWRGGAAREVRGALAACVLLATLAAGGVAVRVHVQAGLPTFSPDDNPAAAHPNAAVRGWSFAHAAARAYWLLLWPRPLCPDYSGPAVPLVHDPWRDTRAWAAAATAMVALGGLAAAAFAAVLRGRRVALYAALLATLPFLPASNLLFPVGFVVAERVMYLPSAGACWLAALALRWLCSRGAARRARVLLAGLLLCVLVAAATTATLRRCEEWRGSTSLWAASLQVRSAVRVRARCATLLTRHCSTAP